MDVWLTQPLATLLAGSVVTVAAVVTFASSALGRRQVQRHFASQHDLDRERSLQGRYTEAATQLGARSSVIRLAGALSLVALADEWLRRGSTVSGQMAIEFADLERVLLSRANLVEARLVNAYARKAVLDHADLTRANLRRANLTEVDLTDANLAGADLEGSILSEAVLRGTNLTGASLGDHDPAELAARGAILDDPSRSQPLPSAHAAEDR